MSHFRPATWEEALERAAAGLKTIRNSKGVRALAGFGSAKGSNEEAYLFQKLVRTGFGSNNVDHCTRLCHASSVAALTEGIGSGAVTATFNECKNSDVIIVIGANPTENHPVAATFFKQAAKRGAKLIVMDPRGQALKRHAVHMLQFTNGTDDVSHSTISRLPPPRQPGQGAIAGTRLVSMRASKHLTAVALWFLGGLAFSLLTYSIAVAAHGGVYLIARGAIVVGLLQFLYGGAIYLWRSKDEPFRPTPRSDQAEKLTAAATHSGISQWIAPSPTKTRREFAEEYRPYNVMPEFSEGTMAYLAGNHRNPYPKNTVQAQAWDRGRECCRRYEDQEGREEGGRPW